MSEALPLSHGAPESAPVAGAVSPPEPSMLEAALRYHELGFNPIPQDHDKKPLVKWRPYQDRRVTEQEIREGLLGGLGVVWLEEERMEALDFEGHAYPSVHWQVLARKEDSHAR